jgi:hypothetical protein
MTMISIRRVLAVAASLGLLALVPAALGAKPVAQTLNPPPAAFYTCKPNGNGTICHGSRTFAVDPYDTEIVCGSGPSAFDIWDQGIAVDQVATRWYDASGNLVRREIHEDWRPGQFSNPLTAAVVPYRQTSNIVDVLAVPGDFGSATETQTGQNNFTVPGHGIVLHNSGRVVTAPDGTIEFSSGKQNIADYFDNGNTAVLDELCSVLGG